MNKSFSLAYKLIYLTFFVSICAEIKYNIHLFVIRTQILNFVGLEFCQLSFCIVSTKIIINAIIFFVISLPDMFVLSWSEIYFYQKYFMPWFYAFFAVFAMGFVDEKCFNSCSYHVIAIYLFLTEYYISCFHFEHSYFNSGRNVLELL